MFHLNKLGYSDYVSGKISKEEFGKNIAQQYRAVPDPRTGFTYADSAASRNAAQVTNAQFLQALEASKTGASALPIAPSPSTARQFPPPQRRDPSVVLVPADTGNQTPSSVASPSNHSAISVDTTHPENFLALYSKLIYQVV